MPATEAWFQTRTITDEVWAISDNGGSMIYLVAGSERALLIDTGWGIGDLPGLVRSLTPLPVIVVNTHVHPDHTLGNPQFAEVHIPADDIFLITLALTDAERPWMLKNVVPQPLPAKFDPTGWGSAMPAAVISIKDGHCFELGQRSIQVIAVPGHTPGSICLFDQQSRLLFTGDSVLSETVWMHLEESRSLRQYADSLRKLRAFSAKIDGILSGHEHLQKLPCPAQTIDDLLGGAEAILSGKLVGEPEHTFAGDGLRGSFGHYSIIYRADRLQ